MRGALGIVLVVGCYSPRIQEGAPCTSDDDCPRSQVCDRGRCVGMASDIDAPPPPDEAPEAMPLFAPSNGIDFAALAMVSVPITIDGTATFDTSTGRITGAIERDAGTGVIGDIHYEQRSFMNVELGVFVVSELTVNAAGEIRFAGTRPAVFLTQRAMIAGKIDGSAGAYGTDADRPGPGGSAGRTANGTPVNACGGTGGETVAGSETGNDGGGGGGGGGAAGGNGGDAGPQDGGAGGAECIAATLEPLIGGGGGGGGGVGEAATAPRGGGGGGALQITARDLVTVTGTIVMSGAGGAGGPAGAADVDAAAGSGGGAGGAILLEATALSISGTLAANGGGGGGPGFRGSAGQPGAPGGTTTAVAAGGAIGGGNGTPGGTGGAGDTPAAAAADADAGQNGGGGGGAVGRIYLRAASAPATTGTITPPPGTGTL